MEAAAFRRAVSETGPFRELLLHYAFALNMQRSMAAARNGRHLLQDSLARCLLMSNERSEGKDFAMTHEFLSLMLGIRRASVTVVASTLQKAGLIRYEQGRIKVLDQAGLADAACECHAGVQNEFAVCLAPETTPRLRTYFRVKKVLGTRSHSIRISRFAESLFCCEVEPRCRQSSDGRSDIQR